MFIAVIERDGGGVTYVTDKGLTTPLIEKAYQFTDPLGAKRAALVWLGRYGGEGDRGGFMVAPLEPVIKWVVSL